MICQQIELLVLYDLKYITNKNLNRVKRESTVRPLHTAPLNVRIKLSHVMQHRSESMPRSPGGFTVAQTGDSFQRGDM